MTTQTQIFFIICFFGSIWHLSLSRTQACIKYRKVLHDVSQLETLPTHPVPLIENSLKALLYHKTCDIIRKHLHQVMWVMLPLLGKETHNDSNLLIETATGSIPHLFVCISCLFGHFHFFVRQEIFYCNPRIRSRLPWSSSNSLRLCIPYLIHCNFRFCNY